MWPLPYEFSVEVFREGDHHTWRNLGRADTVRKLSEFGSGGKEIDEASAGTFYVAFVTLCIGFVVGIHPVEEIYVMSHMQAVAGVTFEQLLFEFEPQFLSQGEGFAISATLLFIFRAWVKIQAEVFSTAVFLGIDFSGDGTDGH